MTTITPEVKRKLNKLHTLAQQGEENEKDTAQRLLDKLLKKHGTSINEVLFDEQEYYQEYNYGSKAERIILEHLFSKVSNNGGQYTYYPHKGILRSAFRYRSCFRCS